MAPAPFHQCVHVIVEGMPGRIDLTGVRADMLKPGVGRHHVRIVARLAMKDADAQLATDLLRIEARCHEPGTKLDRRLR